MWTPILGVIGRLIGIWGCTFVNNSFFPDLAQHPYVIPIKVTYVTTIVLFIFGGVALGQKLDED
jgi:hypothetical protein